MTIWGFDGAHRLLVSNTGLLLSQLSGNFFSRGKLAASQWHYIVFTYDASAKTASYYIDGLFDSSAVVPAAAAAFTSPYFLGEYGSAPYYKWNGMLAESAFYRKALTAAQVRTH